MGDGGRDGGRVLSCLSRRLCVGAMRDESGYGNQEGSPGMSDVFN